MKKIANYTLPAFALSALLFSACQPELEIPVATPGSANFSRYISVGNSLAAGYADNGLYREGQLNSYPAILAQQFQLVGGGEFVQPLFTEAERNGSGYISLSGFNANGQPIIVPVNTNLAIRAYTPGNTPLYTKYTTPIHNLGVPGMSVLTSSLPAFSGLNPYFERLVESPGTVSYTQYAGTSNPTFFTCWLGSNDVLTYAGNGGVEIPQNTFDDLTDVPVFRSRYNALADTLAKNNTKGVLATIPDITSIPFFTAITPAGVLATEPAGTELWVTPASGQGAVRQAETSDLILLSTRSAIGRVDNVNTPDGPMMIPHGFSKFNPLTNGEVLDAFEINKIRTATTAFNGIIRDAALRLDLAVADMNLFLSSIQPAPTGTGAIYSYGVTNSPAFISGNIFSLDGVHLTPRGNALAANEFIRVINQKYGANIPQVNPNSYTGVKFR